MISKLSRNSIVRLAQYKNILNKLSSLGLVKVFSDNLADAAGVNSAQVRKDFSQFSIKGNRRGGYDVNELRQQLAQILGKDEVTKVIVVGIGNIGKALVHYKGFEKENIRIVAGFDSSLKSEGKIGNVPIYPIDRIEDFILRNKIRIAVISVPDTSAQEVLNILVKKGIKGILNFAPIRLTTPKSCVIHNVNLGLELETVIFYVNLLKDKKVAIKRI